MASETWPGTLPQYVDRESFTYTMTSSSLSTNMSTGYAKRRKRYTGQYAYYDVTMKMTRAQADIFEQFFNNNLGYGVVLFNFPDPLFIESTIEVKIFASKNEAPYSFSVYGDNDQVVLSMRLERLITGYTTISHNTWPSSLEDCPLYPNYSVTTQSGLVRDQDPLQGYMSVRRRFTAVIRRHTIEFLFTRTQLQTFFNFYYSLGYGSLSFEAPYPFDSSLNMKARFDTSDGYGFTVGYYNDTDLFSVQFVWEELPLLKEYE